MSWLKQCRIAIVFFILMTVVTGLIYPGIVTVIAQLCFYQKANGSLVEDKGKVVGSLLIGQLFTEPQYFWGRPSASSPAYNAQSSGGSNLGLLNPVLFKNVQGYVQTLKQADPHNVALIPVDLVTASGSGLDPDISPAAAYYQVSRVAAARHVSTAAVYALVQSHITPRQWRVWGEPVVNVLALNLALDQLSQTSVQKR